MVSIAENITDLRTQASEPGTNKNILRLVCEMIEELLMQVTSVLKPSDAATKVVNWQVTVDPLGCAHEAPAGAASDASSIRQWNN